VIIIQYRTLQIMCETPAQAAEIAKALAAGGPAPAEELRLPFGQNGNGQERQPATVKALVSKLGPRQKRLLKALVTHNGRMRDTELVRAAGVDSVSALGACLGPVYKLTKTEGPARDFFTREEQTDENGKREKVEYVIADWALEQVREGV
jgi:hypothetical protein